MTTTARGGLISAIDAIDKLDNSEVVYVGIHFDIHRHITVDLHSPKPLRAFSSHPSPGAIYDPDFEFLNKELERLLEEQEGGAE